jgi:hypothetical protein
MQRHWFLSLLITFVLSCSQHEDPTNPPVDHPYYPSALLQNQNTLYVFSSNFDQRFDQANVPTVDLAAVDAAILQGTQVIGNSVVSSSGFIPNFADGPTFSPASDQILYVSRGDRSLRSIPLSGNGGLIACPNSTALIGQDCSSHAPAASLQQANPYYLTLFGTTNSLTGGVIGYLLDPTVQRATHEGNFNFPAFFEMERFTWNDASSSAQITQDIGIGQELVAAPLANRRYNVRIGGLTNVGDYQYFLAERPTEMQVVPAAPQLVRVALADLQSADAANIKTNSFDLSATGMFITVSTFGVRGIPNLTAPTTLQFFISNGVLGNLFQFELALGQPPDDKGRLNLKLKNQQEICNHPTDIKVTPDQNKVIVACDNGKMLVYDAATLAPLGIDPSAGAIFGRGPVRILFDARVAAPPYRFYAANFLDGSLSVFDVNDVAVQNQPILVRKAHIFQPSPPNREGGAE